MMHAMRMCLVFSTSLFIFGCAHDGPGLRMMNERAEYSDEAPETSELNLQASAALGEEGQLAVRPEPRVALVWIHPQRLSDREHFWGAWLSLRLEDEHWEAKSSSDLEQDSPASKPKDGKMRVKKRKALKAH